MGSLGEVLKLCKRLDTVEVILQDLSKSELKELAKEYGVLLGTKHSEEKIRGNILWWCKESGLYV